MNTNRHAHFSAQKRICRTTCGGLACAAASIANSRWPEKQDGGSTFAAFLIWTIYGKWNACGA